MDLTGELERGHGRWEVRDLTVVAVDTEVSPFPHIAQIIKCTRIYQSTTEGSEPEMSVRLFGTSIVYEKKQRPSLSVSSGNTGAWKTSTTLLRQGYGGQAGNATPRIGEKTGHRKGIRKEPRTLPC